MKSILVTGCNRGIGLGLIKHLIKEKKHVIATCRSIENAKELNDICSNTTNLHIMELDLRDYNKFSTFAEDVRNIVGGDGLNVLINNAGISSKFTRINLVKSDQLLEAFKVNTIAPIMLTQALLPLLKLAGAQTSMVGPSLIINVTSILGSISANTDGGFYPYRCSKVALNMATKSLSIDLAKDKVHTFALHPGWVKTDMGGAKAPLDVTTSVTSILKLMNEANESYNGNVYDYTGQKIEW